MRALFNMELVGWFALKSARKNQEILLKAHSADPFPNFSTLTNSETMRVCILFPLSKVTATGYPVRAHQSSQFTDFTSIDITKKAY